ncbi:MAG: hypothetical protein ABIH65_01930 [Nanoarchaeota archaeon]
MKKQKILGVIFLSVSILTFIINISITGAVIGATFPISLNLIALVFFIGGLILILYDSRNNREKIREIIEQYKTGNISPVETVKEINEVSEIQQIKFKTGLQHSIYGERDSYPIPLKNGKKAEELAILEYLVAIRNHPEQRKENELHIGKGLSTKHYSEGIKKMIESIKGKYAKDLQAKLGIA